MKIRKGIIFDHVKRKSKWRWEADRGDAGTSTQRDLVVEAHATVRRRRHHRMVVVRLHEIAHHHHGRLLLLVMMRRWLTGVRRRDGRRWDRRARFVTATAAVTAAAAAAATQIVRSAVIDAGRRATATLSAFALLNQTTPFGSGVLEPDLRIHNNQEINTCFKSCCVKKRGPRGVFLSTACLARLTRNRRATKQKPHGARPHLRGAVLPYTFRLENFYIFSSSE